MASRTEVRGILKHNQRNSKIADERFSCRLSSNSLEYNRSDCLNERRDEDKLLNIGVLDWGSLEKWKASGIVHKDSYRCKIDEQSASKHYTSQDSQHSGDGHSVANHGKNRQTSMHSGSRLLMHATEAKQNAFDAVIGSQSVRFSKFSISVASLDPTLKFGEEFQESEAKPDVFSAELRSQIPRSRSLSYERDSESIMTAFDYDLSSDSCTTELYEKTHSQTDLDQEKSEEESRRSKHHSPGKRFSFSINRFSRSFSFKGLSSDDPFESNHVRFDASEKRNTHSGARASPLKRLLESLLKTKSRSSSNLNPANNNVPPQDMSTIMTCALVQLTIRNGFPLFQFVVDDNTSCILGATMRSSASSSKDDSVRYCTFYSVEMKKKKSVNWLMHGNKERQQGFVYSMIGQMRLNNSFSSDLTEQKLESVLFDFETKQSDQATEKAAIVIKRHEGSKKGTATTVILPGGVHGFPKKGKPSRLIDRWRSGGLCDCGGWDIGCKLRILSNETLHKFPESFQLCHEGRSQQKQAAFTMTQVEKGKYKVEFTSSMSLLQAFFISVTMISCDYEEAKAVEVMPFTCSSSFNPISRV